MIRLKIKSLTARLPFCLEAFPCPAPPRLFDYRGREQEGHQHPEPHGESAEHGPLEKPLECLLNVSVG